MRLAATSSLFHGALFLLKGDGFLLVFEDVAVGAFAVDKGVVASFPEGFSGRQIFECHGDFILVRVGAEQFAVDRFGLVTWPAWARLLPVFHVQFEIFGCIFQEDFQGQTSGSGQVGKQGGVGQELVCGGVWSGRR